MRRQAQYARDDDTVPYDRDLIRETVVGIPQAIDWTWEPKAINAILRTYWDAIQLSDDMQPMRAEWRLPKEYIA